MSDASTTRMIEMYMEEASAPMFLSGHFRSPPENFHTSEKVEIDIERDDEDVAIVVHDLSAGPNKNEATVYVNKGFTPPIYDEEGIITSYGLIKRMPGQNPFASPEYGANALRQAFRVFRKLERKIRRAIELQASQVLQTGELTLTDSAGISRYVLDFQPKDSHIDTVSATWALNGSSGTPIDDLADFATVIRRDGKSQPNRLIFGASAYLRFIHNEQTKAYLQRDGFGSPVGMVVPQTRGEGATFQGYVWIGHYKFEMWTYDGFFRDPSTGNHVPYVGDNNVIMLSQNSRLDLTFGAIPMIVPPEQRVLPFLPPRMGSSERGLDLTTNAWVTPDGKHLMVSAGTRPLCIPTAIDTTGCLTVVT